MSKEKYMTDELKVELAASADYFERTGKNLYNRSLVDQRKIIEQYMEDHEIQIS